MHGALHDDTTNGTPSKDHACEGRHPMTANQPLAPALDYLTSRHVMTVATAGAAGPAAAAVFYARLGLDLVFLSAPTTLHVRNLAAHPQVAVTVQDQDSEWRQIRGLQINGTAELLAGTDGDAARDAFLAAFPAIFGAAATGDDIARALAHVGWYRVRIERLRFIDNAQGLGHADEWTRAELTD